MPVPGHLGHPLCGEFEAAGKSARTGLLRRAAVAVAQENARLRRALTVTNAKAAAAYAVLAVGIVGGVAVAADPLSALAAFRAPETVAGPSPAFAAPDDANATPAPTAEPNQGQQVIQLAPGGEVLQRAQLVVRVRAMLPRGGATIPAGAVPVPPPVVPVVAPSTTSAPTTPAPTTPAPTTPPPSGPPTSSTPADPSSGLPVPSAPPTG